MASPTAAQIPRTGHRLGFAVKTLGAGGLPSHDARRWQSGPHLAQSLRYLEAILDYLDAVDIRMYRFSSSLAPYASHPELSGFQGQVRECEAELFRLGELARVRGIRLSSHPGQYTVLNSERPEVATVARTEIEVQAELLDALGCVPEAVVVIHVGGRPAVAMRRSTASCAGTRACLRRRSGAWSSRTTTGRSA